MRVSTIVAALLALGFASATHPSLARAQDGRDAPAPAADASDPRHPIERLLEGAAANSIHHFNQLEIGEANEALARLKRAEVRKFARMLIQDHAANERALVKLAQSEAVALFLFQRATFEAAAEDQLRRLPFKEFDVGFLLVQLQGHARALQNLEMMMGMVRDPEIKAFIAATIPVVRRHLEEAKDLLDDTGASD